MTELISNAGKENKKFIEKRVAFQDQILPIVIDNGSGMIKAGFGGDDYPCCKFWSIVCKPKFKSTMINSYQS